MSRALRLTEWATMSVIFGAAIASCHKDALDPMGGTGIVTGRAGASGAAGALGSAGALGIGGGGAVGGDGGSGTCTFRSDCPGSCGNGRRDSCTWASACGDMIATEPCDGNDLGAWTCAALSYASGTPTCSEACQLDGSSCSECAVPDGVAVQCSDAPAGSNPALVRIAATADEIGLLWLQPGLFEVGPTLEFDRLSPDLKLLSANRYGNEGAFATLGTSKAFDVGASPAGWIIVASGSDGIFIHAIDRGGNDLGKTVFGGGDGSLLEGPFLVSRPGGPPLVAWVNGTYPPAGPPRGTLHVVPVAADGLSFGPAHDLDVEDWTRPHGLAFAGDAFVAAIVAGSASNPGQIRVQRIETDGTPSTVVDALPGVNATFVAPFACGSDLCLDYNAPIPGATSDTDTGFMWTKIDANGTPGPTITVLSFRVDRAYEWAIPTTLGGAVVTVLGGAPDDTVGVARSAANGLTLNLAATITRFGGQSSYVPAVAVRGSDLLVAWGPAPRGNIRIARVSF